MEWFNVTSYLPQDGQKVLISVKGVYYVVNFDKDRLQFKIEDELRETTFGVNEDIYWTEFVEPLWRWTNLRATENSLLKYFSYNIDNYKY
jgi:hypothetical protein